MNYKIKFWIYFIAALSSFFAGMASVVHFQVHSFFFLAGIALVSVSITVYFLHKISLLKKE